MLPKTTAPPDPYSTVEPQVQRFPEAAGYRFVDKLGEGGMGVVYKAVHEATGETVALKTLRCTGGAVADNAARRFECEACLLRSLNHRHIIGYRDFGRTPDSIYLTMELVAQGDAWNLVQRDGPFAVYRIE